MKIIDLTHSFTDNMPAFPGDPPASLKPITKLEESGYNDHEIKSPMHVGTHMDAPLHMIADGKRMDEISPDKFMGEGIVLDVRGKEVIDGTVFDNVTVNPGSIVLVYTGFGTKYKSPGYDEGQPTITEDFAQKAVSLNVKIVGMDIFGPDQPPFLTHKTLLGSEVLIIENLVNLELLLNENHFEVIALPMKLHADAAPVRVIAVVR